MNHPTMHIYRLATGVFTGATVTGPSQYLADNIPEGCGAVAGVRDPDAERFDAATGTLVAYQPPAPPDTALTTWAWDAAGLCWVPTPTTAALAQDVRAERDRRMAACDWVVARATELGQAVPAEWLTYRAALRNVPAQAGFPAAVVWP